MIQQIILWVIIVIQLGVIIWLASDKKDVESYKRHELQHIIDDLENKARHRKYGYSNTQLLREHIKGYY